MPFSVRSPSALRPAESSQFPAPVGGWLFSAGPRFAFYAAAVLVIALPGCVPAFGHLLPPLTAFGRAERIREALERRPQSQRTRSDYEHVLDAFRVIYHTDPRSPKADASVNAVAVLLTEEGRAFSDEKTLRDSIGECEFLRQQYPGSRYRFSALITEGQIYWQDLGDREQAAIKFREFLKSYPHHPLADQARDELKEIRVEEVAAKRKGRPSPGRLSVPAAQVSSDQAFSPAGRDRVERGESARESQPQVPVNPRRAPAMTPPPIAPLTARSSDSFKPGATLSAAQPLQDPASAGAAERVPLVTGIRHWSTPVYTRIAIDLGDQVPYEAGRVPNPDRIYLDLHGARLAPGLIGTSIDVAGDGFLKRIRAAQFSNNVTRIVLNVSSVADYSAFFLPNPWRLIIDIHGRQAGADRAIEEAGARSPPSMAGASAAPASASSAVGGEAASASGTGEPIQTAMGTGFRGHREDSASAREVATLGQQPDRVQATNTPTTQPIATSVAGARPASQANDGSLASTSVGSPSVTGGRKKSMESARPSSAPTASSSEDGAFSSATHEAAPTAAGERSLVRTLGLKIGRIVVDAGHGGYDSGTVGAGGIEEKDVVLDVALRLGKLLRQRLGAEVIFTRNNDTFVPLETRTAIANKAQADLFISIHANSSSDPSARGVETYYLNFTTSPDALEVAARENAVSDESIHELSDLVRKIALRDKIEESREFAFDVQKSLYGGLEDGNPGLKDRGVKQAPFVVLIGANMPSILAEISFLTNPEDASELRRPAYREHIAESIYSGVAKYISGLSGVHLAENPSRPIGN